MTQARNRRPWMTTLEGETLVILNPIALRREIDALVHSNAEPKMVLDAITRHTERLWYRHDLDESYGDMPEMMEYVRREGRRNVGLELAERLVFAEGVSRG